MTPSGFFGGFFRFMEENTTEQKQTEAAIVEDILSIKKQYEESTREERTEFAEIYASYMGKMDEVVTIPYDIKQPIPKLRTEISYIKPFIYSGDPEVEFEGVGDEDRTIAKIYEKMINHRFRTIPNFNDKIESWVGQAVGTGTSELKLIWKFATTKKKATGPGGEYEYEEPIQDEPDVEVPNHLDVYYNPIITNVENQPCLIFRSVTPIKDIKDNPIYNYVNTDGKRNADILEENKSGLRDDTYSSSSLLKTDFPNAQESVTSGTVEVFEKITNDRIQTIANGKLLRDIENPYGFKTVVKLIFEPNIIPNRYSGIGVGQNTKGLGEMFYKLFSQALTNVKMVNNPMYNYRIGTGIDPKQFVSKPGGGIGSKEPGKDLIPILFPDLKQGFLEILNKVDDEHKRASGASDLIQGSASNDTLGQDEIAQANISNRFELIVRRFKNALAQVADMMLKMELQNLQSPDASILRIFPEDMREQIYQVLISSKDSVKYNVKIKGETNVSRNKNLEAKRQVEMFNLMQNFLTDKEKRAFGRRIAELQGIDNIDELIGETNPIMEQQEQMQLAQGQIGMETGMDGQIPQQGMIDGGVTSAT